MAVLTLISTMPTHCALHKHILSVCVFVWVCVCVCEICAPTREKTHYSFTLRKAIVRVYQSVWGDAEASGSAWPREHTHAHTGHYTHSRLPDERAGQREREDWAACSIYDPAASTLQAVDGSLSLAGPMPPNTEEGHPVTGCWRGLMHLYCVYMWVCVVRNTSECAFT